MKHCIRLGILSGWGLLGVLAPSLPAAEPVTSPAFQEVYDLLRANLPGMDEVGMQKAAVRGLLSQFSDRVSIVSERAPAAPSIKDAVEVRLLEDRFVYLKLSALDGVAEESALKLKALVASNEVSGGILDLRFAKGHDFASAVAVGSQLVSTNQLLLDWGEGLVRSQGIHGVRTVVHGSRAR